MSLFRRFSLFAAALFAFYAAACGGGNSGTTILPPPPPPPGTTFSNASLNGQYAFFMAGTDATCEALLVRAGTFTANGSGTITGGVEDINDDCIGTGTLQFTSGSYSIQSDGRGTLHLTNSTGTTNYSISLSTTSNGFIIQQDINDSASGSFQKQNPAAFSLTSFASGYAFDFSGVDATGVTPESIVGRLTTDGVGGINAGQFDVNDGGAILTAQAFNGSYSLDASFPGSGRLLVTAAARNFACYIVDATRLKCAENSAAETLGGEVFQQTGGPFSAASLNGPFAFAIGGASGVGPIATGGRFNLDGVGNVTTVVLDENNSGTVTSLPSGTVSGTYTVDASGLGRGTVSVTDTSKGSFTFTFYLVAPTRAVIAETDSGIVSDGNVFGQTGSTINAALVNGDYSFNWTGVDINGEQDFSGALVLSNASPSMVTGTTDFNELADVAGKEQLFFNIPTTATLTFGASPAGRNALPTSVAIPGTPVAISFNAYFVDGNTFLVVAVDGGHVTAGIVVRQP